MNEIHINFETYFSVSGREKKQKMKNKTIISFYFSFDLYKVKIKQKIWCEVSVFMLSLLLPETVARKNASHQK